jgi:hypothetical protein
MRVDRRYRLSERTRSVQDFDRLLSDQEKYILKVVSSESDEYQPKVVAYYGPVQKLARANKDPNSIETDLNALETLGLIQWSPEDDPEGYVTINWEKPGLDYSVYAEYIDPEMSSDDPIERAITTFGLTDSFNEAGYILPDGRMLDFSGKREGGTPGNRAYDHRDIGRVLGIGGSEALWEFMSRTGAIRSLPETGDLTIAKKPTSQQLYRIEEWADWFVHTKGTIGVEITPTRDAFMMGDYTAFKEFTDSKKFIGYIKRAFSKAKVSEDDNVGKRVCAWCGKVLGDAPGLKKGEVTHSICPSCLAKVYGQLDNRRGADIRISDKPTESVGNSVDIRYNAAVYSLVARGA